MHDGAHTAPRRAGPREPELLLGARRFLPLFLVQALGAFNDNLFKAAFVSLLTYRLAETLEMNLVTLTAIASGVFILPFALLAPLAGQISDRIDKAAMMRAVKFLEIVLMIGAAVAYHRQDVTLLYVVLFLMGSQSALFSPIKYGVLPQYLKPAELIRGNGLMQAATFFAILLGTIAGTQLILTERGVLVVSIGVISVAVVGFIASLYALPAPPYGDAEALRTRWTGMWAHAVARWRARRGPFLALWLAIMAGVATGWSQGGLSGGGAGGVALAASAAVALVFALWPSIEDAVGAGRSVPVAWRAILSISWFWFVGATFMTLLPAFTKKVLGADENVLTLLLAAFSIGVAIGSVLCGFLYRGEVKVGLAPWGAVGIALFSIDLGLGTRVGPAGEYLMNAVDFLSSGLGWRVFLDFIGLAICAGVYVTPLNAVYQHAAPAEARGRVVACSNMMDSTFMASSAATIPLLGLAAFEPQQIMAMIGATGLIAGFFVARRAPETRFGRFALSLWPTAPNA